MLQQTLLLNTPVVNTIGREPQREVEDSSSAEVKLMFRGQVAIVKVGMLLPWTRSRNGLLRMLCTQEVGARLVAIPAFPVPLIPIPTPIPFEDSLLLCTQYHGRHHSCFSISWLPVITRRIYTHTHVAVIPAVLVTHASEQFTDIHSCMLQFAASFTLP
jgi:hypothetical protein